MVNGFLKTALHQRLFDSSGCGLARPMLTFGRFAALGKLSRVSKRSDREVRVRQVYSLTG